MMVSEWMTQPVHTVKPRDNASHARELLEQHRINQLPVAVDAKLVGIVTDRDLRDAFPSVFESVAEGATHGDGYVEPNKLFIESIMTHTLVSIASDATLSEAAQIMCKERIGALPVIDDDKLVGVLCRSDILKAFIALAERTGEG
jgi:acetoin utilization protein AcuB